jgi:hypothetical protein
MSSHPVNPPSDAPINCGIYSADNPQPSVASTGIHKTATTKTGHVFPPGHYMAGWVVALPHSGGREL